MDGIVPELSTRDGADIYVTAKGWKWFVVNNNPVIVDLNFFIIFILFT